MKTVHHDSSDYKPIHALQKRQSFSRAGLEQQELILSGSLQELRRSRTLLKKKNKQQHAAMTCF